MNILIGILSMISLSFGTIFWKKALSYKCPKNLFSLFAYVFPIIFIISFIILGFTDFSYGEKEIIKVLILSLLVVVIYYFSSQISQYLYKNEKISVLTPFENINKILSIILAFIIFGNVSIKSFLITLFAGIIVIIGSIDFKKVQVPRLLKIQILQQVLSSISLIIIGYILTKITAIDYYIISMLGNFLLTIIIVFANKEFLFTRNLSFTFFKNRMGGSMLGGIYKILTLIIIGSLGVTIGVLFGYLYIGFILILSYIFFNDKPSKKNIILTIVLSLLVGLGYYFK